MSTTGAIIIAGVIALYVASAVFVVRICERRREPKQRRKVIARGWRGWNWNEDPEWE